MMELITPRPEEDLLDLARRCGAVYICPTVGGVRTGPLVVYARIDSRGLNYVGDFYFNARYIEQYPDVVEAFALQLCDNLYSRGLLFSFDTVCGIPQGGRTFGQALARVSGKRFVYPDKLPVPTEPGRKQQYTWDFSQVTFEPGERVALAEDVFNNFQNTDHTLSAIAMTGASVVVLVGAINRSMHHDMIYTPVSGSFAGCKLPVVVSVRRPFPSYRQDDPEVAGDIAAGKLELEVKKNWGHLLDLMRC